MIHPYRESFDDGSRLYCVNYRWFPQEGIVSIYASAIHVVRAKDFAEAAEKFHKTFRPGHFFIAEIGLVK